MEDCKRLNPTILTSWGRRHTSSMCGTHTGLCAHVTDVEPAAVHDITVYKKNRPLLLAGLKAGRIDDPVILADQGYKAPDIPELFVPAQPVSTVNGKRPIVENYFGRMAATFASIRHRYRFSIEHINLHVRALCYPTNHHVFLSPLRCDEYLFPVNWACASQRGREEKWKQKKNGNEKEE